MDACFELMILNDHPVRNLEVSQKKIIWEGIEFPQSPKNYLWGEYISLNESQTPQRILNYLPSSFAHQEWFYFSIKGEILDLLELEVNGSFIDWNNKSLESLFDLVLKPQKMWIIIFDWQCDQIDKVYRLSIQSTIKKLKSNLKYNELKEGFIILLL